MIAITQPIGVMGCLPRLPQDFPLSYSENSGNMVHACAPFRIFDSAHFIRDSSYKASGCASFVEFVNKRCSHLIVTLANTLRIGDEDSAKYQRLIDFLQKIEKPIVVFGLGIQAKSLDHDTATLPPTAIELVKLLSSRASLVGVRGGSTKTVLERLCGIKNAYVTGCPSIFSDLRAISRVRENLKRMEGRPAYSGTRYFEAEESTLFGRAIASDCWLVEPVNRFNHEYFLKAALGSTTYEDVPYFAKKLVAKNDSQALQRFEEYFQRRYRLFRSTEEWYTFIGECVSFSYGTRFHANMACLVSGKPALWVTHDERTRELTEFMKLPAVDINSAHHLSPSELAAQLSYEEFFDNFSKLVQNFNTYLSTNGLPVLPKSKV